MSPAKNLENVAQQREADVAPMWKNDLMALSDETKVAGVVQIVALRFGPGSRTNNLIRTHIEEDE